MEFDLTCHPQFPMPEVRSVRVVAERAGPRRMALRYVVEGDVSAIVMPPIAVAERADELWQTTCFELFLSRAGSEHYVELNFSPSSQWACYVFKSYRTGMHSIEAAAMPRIDLHVEPGVLELGALVDLSFILDKNVGIDWVLNIAAILERRDGAKSYWALSHPPGQPDFHQRDCFTGVLQAAAFA